MPNLNFILCDDNSAFLDKTVAILKNIFEKHSFNAQIVFYSSNPLEVLDYSSKNPVDVLFLDIDLNSSVTGIEVAENFRKINKLAYIIFLTGHFEYSMLAYKVKTFDYLVKPALPERIEETVIRLYDDSCANTNKFIRLCNGKYLLKKSDILYIEKMRTKAVVHTSSSKIELYSTFSDLQNCLPENFVRCQKSYIVNTDNITKVDSQKNMLYVGSKTIGYSNCFVDIERMMNLNGKFSN